MEVCNVTTVVGNVKLLLVGQKLKCQYASWCIAQY